MYICTFVVAHLGIMSASIAMISFETQLTHSNAPNKNVGKQRKSVRCDWGWI